MQDGLVTLFLCGDVMTGRGVDQVLPHPGDARLWEPLVRDARRYVELAEAVNGPIPRSVDFAWPWGDALATLEEVAPDARVINLETSVKRADEAAADKVVHYRMSPENVGCLTVARPDACALANNHVLDFGRAGLAETCEVLTAAGIPIVGAGRDADEASRPAAIMVTGGRRVIVFSCGTHSSGIPRGWAAGGAAADANAEAHRAGVNLLPDLSATTADAVVDRVRQMKRRGDVVVASIHWGSNWGYDVPADHIRFAHRLVDDGVDVVHGHSSHHVRPVEIYRGKLILYGCGDLVDDYEGIGGHEAYRSDLRVLYFASVDPDTGRLVRLRMVPMQARQMRLHSASADDVDYLAGVFNRINHRIAVEAANLAPDGAVTRPPAM